MNRRAFLHTAGGLAASGTGLAAYAHYVEPKRIEYTRHTLGGGMPSFVQLSDLHLRSLSDVHADIAGEVTRRMPEFIVFSGDTVDRTDALPLLAEFLRALPAVPKYAILGNWEYWGSVSQAGLRQTFENANGRVLVNESVLHRHVALCGLDDFVAGRPDLAATLRGLPHDALRVLLAHCPGQRDEERVRSADFELMLSGHTHGGQVRPFGIRLVRPRGSGRYVAGWYRGDGPRMYVSRGIGTSVLPVRLGARPEVVFFD